MIKTIILLILIQTASNKTVTIDAHPACEGIQFDDNGTSYQVGEIVCIDADSVFKDLISKQGFE